MNKVVARYADGRLVKGMTADFFANKPVFHVMPTGSPPGTTPLEIATDELKALFFVKDFDGNQQHVEKKEFDPVRPPAGRKIRVQFADGEILIGTTTGYQPGRPGFFLVPADEGSNIDRAYVVASASVDIRFI
jgi:hypothetical protein